MGLLNGVVPTCAWVIREFLPGHQPLACRSHVRVGDPGHPEPIRLSLALFPRTRG